MWSDDNGAYVGKHYQLAETLCSPAPVSQPRPRIMIGGSGERKTLRLVAAYADACNIFGDPATIAHKVEVLKGHCSMIGRDPNEIEVTALVGPAGDGGPDELVRRLEEYAAIGVSTVMTGAVGADPVAHLHDGWAPAMARIAEIEPARL
jgi:alkanesulfonate monooxygenase SsuD/methylene tetrahydromethanopterin reductase-like flavin-dependent oxidoreductase (luciferase family)